jgi:chemotaxis protein MotB
MRKKHPEHVNLERWLVSYADFITLLFAFFVVMFAISQADLVKFKKASASIRAAFSSGAVGVVDIQGSSGGSTANQFESAEVSRGRIVDLPAGKTNTASDRDPELQEMRELLEESMSLQLGTSDLSDKVQMQFDSRGLIVRVAAKDFFEQGEAEARFDVRPVLDQIAKVLSKSKRHIRIEGHTDVSEINSKGYPSDWELSAARAAWVAKYWFSRYDLDPSRVGVTGLSHYRPLSQGRAPWEKAKNRRVEIIMLNNQYESK